MKTIARLGDEREAAVEQATADYEAAVAEVHARFARDFIGPDGYPSVSKLNPVELACIIDRIGTKTSPSVPVDKKTKAPLGNQDFVDFVIDRYAGKTADSKTIKASCKAELADRVASRNTNTEREG